MLGPAGELVPDIAERLPGRGFWVGADRATLDRAIAKRVFDRAARRTVALPPDLVERVERLLVERCRDTIGLARRGGGAVAGFEKVCAALGGGQDGLLIEAIDGAEHGRRKIVARAPETRCGRALSAAELGAAFGREHAVHGWVAAGPLADRLATDLGRLAALRAPRETGANAVADRRGSDGV